MAEKINLNIIIDTREQQCWDFSDQFSQDKYYSCSSERGTLKTGDYTLKGLEDILVIERKASSAEIAQNITEDRFEREFKRLAEYKHKFVICEFDMRDIMNYPIGSGIPQRAWSSIKIKGKYILKKITELQLTYGVPFIFAGDFAVEQAIAIFKKVSKDEQQRQT